MRQGTILSFTRSKTALVFPQPKDINAWAQAFGRQISGAVLNPRLRRELQDQPKIEGLCGPMYDGVDNGFGLPVARYEDQQTYGYLSA
jgi:hypothetical protein